MRHFSVDYCWMVLEKMPELSVTAGLFAVAFYAIACVVQLQRLRGGRNARVAVFICGAIAVFAHAISAYGIVRAPGGYQFGITQISSIIALAISVLVLGSSLRKPLDNLFLGLFPLAIVAILLSLMIGSSFPATSLGAGSGSHVLLSVLAYGFISIAALQAIFPFLPELSVEARPRRRSADEIAAFAGHGSLPAGVTLGRRGSAQPGDPGRGVFH